MAGAEMNVIELTGHSQKKQLPNNGNRFIKMDKKILNNQGKSQPQI